MNDPCPVAVEEAAEKYLTLVGQGFSRIDALEHARLYYGVPRGAIIRAADPARRVRAKA